jgi:Carboxypeptidase regulatory-like domain
VSRIRYVILPALFLCAGPLFPQATAVVQITGSVADASGGAVSGAKVTATQTSTGFSRETTSGADGSYLLSNLPIGPYRLEANAAGFKSYTRDGIVLQVNTNPTINVVLEVGALTQSVEVRAAAEMAETQTSGISQVIDQRRVVDLPLNGRQPTQLVLLSGAAVVSPPSDLASSKNYPSSTTISVAGGQANGTYYLLDGADHNDAFGAINLPIPFPDALQEFSVQTNSIPATYGVRAGGVVNIVTASGSNAFHGSAFEFLRNGATNARNFFASSVDQLKRNQFGGTLGGPIVRNKLFFFGGYQGTITHTAPPTTTSFVPNQQVLAGDFSTLASSACSSVRAINDPVTGKQFPGNQIPVSRYSQEALNVLKYIPASNDPCGKILYSVPNNSTENQYLGRADWIQSQRHSVFGRYFYAGADNPAVFNDNLLLTTRPGTIDAVQSAVLGDTFSFSPNATNAFHFTWTRERVNRGGADSLPSISELGLNVAPSPGNFPQISVNGFFSTFCGTCSKASVYSGTKQFADDFSFIKGRHQVSIGGEWIRRDLDYHTSTQQDPAFSFNGQITGSGLSDLLLGLPSSFTQGNLTQVQMIQNYIGLYAADKIRLNSRVSLNLGLRWEPYLPVYDTTGRATHFELASYLAGTHTKVFQNAPPGVTFPGDPGFPQGGTNRHLANFGPRVGMVWDIGGNGRTVIRAGYGILYDISPMQYYDRFGFGPPWASAITLNNPAGGFANPYLNYPGGNPFPQPVPPPADVVFPSAAQWVNFPLNVRVPYLQQWNFNLQQQVGASWLISASYLGNKGTHQWITTQLDPAVYIPGSSTLGNTNNRRILYLLNPAAGAAFSSMVQVDDGSNASYNALLVSANHRLDKHFSVLANYTWSHCINDGDVQSEITGGYQDPNNRAGSHGNCYTDIRQLFNLSLVADAPHFRGNWIKRLAADWELSAIATKRTGFWITPSTGIDSSLTGVGADRPDVVGNPILVNPTLGEWFDTAAFVRNAAGTYGNAARGSLEGPGSFNMDLSLMRRIVIREGQYFQIRAEAFNVLNHPSFQNPGTTQSSQNFGRILSAYDPRIFQFALKFVF